MEKCIIAAVAADGAIGRGNQLLWHIREDLQFFKRTTLGFPVIMGRNTWLSLGRPLPGRTNIIVSSRGGIDTPEGVLVAASLEDAFAACGKGNTPEGAPSPSRCFIIGGAMLYRSAIAETDRLFITHLEATAPDADARFPEIDPAVWRQEECSETFTDRENGIRFRFAQYIRR
ncbi:MAG: dihydrofolate reductase [Alistipes sp.]|nr:dihydrofolate reductase [Candidatus Minthomonas equi]